MFVNSNCMYNGYGMCDNYSWGMGIAGLFQGVPGMNSIYNFGDYSYNGCCGNTNYNTGWNIAYALTSFIGVFGMGMVNNAMTAKAQKAGELSGKEAEINSNQKIIDENLKKLGLDSEEALIKATYNAAKSVSGAQESVNTAQETLKKAEGEFDKQKTNWTAEKQAELNTLNQKNPLTDDDKVKLETLKIEKKNYDDAKDAADNAKKALDDAKKELKKAENKALAEATKAAIQKRDEAKKQLEELLVPEKAKQEKAAMNKADGTVFNRKHITAEDIVKLNDKVLEKYSEKDWRGLIRAYEVASKKDPETKQNIEKLVYNYYSKKSNLIDDPSIKKGLKIIHDNYIKHTQNQ